jgi:hypothetical protein
VKACEQLFEPRGRRVVAEFLDNPIERSKGLDCGREGVARIELEGPLEPQPQDLRQRLTLASRRNGLGGSYDLGKLGWVFVISQRPAKNQGQSNHAHLGDVRQVIETREPRQARQCHTKLGPVPLSRIEKLLECGAEHVLDNHKTRLRGDEKPLWSDRSVRGIACGLVENRHRGNKLTNHAQGRANVQRQPSLVTSSQEIRDTQTRRVIGHNHQRLFGGARSLDRAHRRIARVPKGGEPADPLAQRKLKGRDSREILAEA